MIQNGIGEWFSVLSNTTNSLSGRNLIYLLRPIPLSVKSTWMSNRQLAKTDINKDIKEPKNELVIWPPRHVWDTALRENRKIMSVCSFQRIQQIVGGPTREIDTQNSWSQLAPRLKYRLCWMLPQRSSSCLGASCTKRPRCYPKSYRSGGVRVF